MKKTEIERYLEVLAAEFPPDVEFWSKGQSFSNAVGSMVETVVAKNPPMESRPRILGACTGRRECRNSSRAERPG